MSDASDRLRRRAYNSVLVHNTRTRAVMLEAADELDRITAERDALVDHGLVQYASGRWGASLAGDYELGTFDTREDAVAAILATATGRDRDG